MFDLIFLCDVFGEEIPQEDDDDGGAKGESRVFSAKENHRLSHMFRYVG